MGSELLQILMDGTAASARMLYLTAVNMCVAVALIMLILKKKRSYCLLYCYLVYKVGIYNWLYLQIIGIYMLNFRQAWFVHLAVSVFHYIFLVYVFCYTFYGSLMKVILSATFGDVLGAIVGCGVQYILNVLEGRENILDMSGSFHPLDLLLPVLCYVIFKILKKRGKKAFQWIREREVKHPGLWGTFYVFYLLIGLLSVQGFADRELSIMLRSLILIVLAFLVIITFLGISILQSRQRQVLQKHRFLQKQQELVLLHSKSIQRQVLQTERLQSQLDEQMEKILADAGSAGFDTRLRSYLAQLKEHYQTIETGMYCRDWMVDAVLTYMVPRLRGKGIAFEFQFQNYERGNMDSVDMAQLMMQLLNLKIRSSVRISVGNMKAGVFIELICPDIRKKRVIEKAVKPLLEKYHGEVWQGTKEEKYTFLLSFPGN